MKYKPIIKSMRDVVDYMRDPKYCPATLREELRKLAKPGLHLHSPERRIAMYHEALEHHPREL